MENALRALHVQNNGEISTIPFEDKIVRLFRSYPVNISHGFILEFVYSLEMSLPEDRWADHPPMIVDGILTIPDSPIEDCIAAVFHVFNNLDVEMGVGNMIPPNVAYVLGHVYNVLIEYFDNEAIEAFRIDCDNWECLGYNKEG